MPEKELGLIPQFYKDKRTEGFEAPAAMLHVIDHFVLVPVFGLFTGNCIITGPEMYGSQKNIRKLVYRVREDHELNRQLSRLFQTSTSLSLGVRSLCLDVTDEPKSMHGEREVLRKTVLLGQDILSILEGAPSVTLRDDFLSKIMPLAYAVLDTISPHVDISQSYGNACVNAIREKAKMYRDGENRILSFRGTYPSYSKTW